MGWLAGVWTGGNGSSGLETRVLPGLFAVVVDWERGGLWVPLSWGDFRWIPASRGDRVGLGELARSVLGREVDLWGPEWMGGRVGSLPTAQDLLQSRFSGPLH